MLIQRTCDAENQVENKPSNGPRRAQSTVWKAACLFFIPSILRRYAHVSCRGYVGILTKCTAIAVNQGGTADIVYSSLTDIHLSGTFLFLTKN